MSRGSTVNVFVPNLLTMNIWKTELCGRGASTLFFFWEVPGFNSDQETSYHD
jgi:hypothetical protein